MKIEKKNGVVIVDVHKDIEKRTRLKEYLDSEYCSLIAEYRVNRKEGYLEKAWIYCNKDCSNPKNIKAFYERVEDTLKRI